MRKTLLITLMLLTIVSIGQQIHLVTIPENQRSLEQVFDVQDLDHDQNALIRFNQIPNPTQIAKLNALGISLFDYIPDRAYYARFAQSSEISSDQLSRLGIMQLIWLNTSHKIDPQLSNLDNLPNWTEEGEYLKAYVHFFKGEESRGLNEVFSIAQVTLNNQNWIEVKVLKDNLQSLASLSTVRYIEPVTAPFEVEEIDAMTNQRSNTLRSAGLNFDGTGVGVHVGDGGTASAHLDYEGRITYTSGINESDHATHVVGIVGGAGNFNPMIEGQAPGADIYSYSGSAILYSSSVLNTALGNNVVITQHSLGWGCNGGYNGSAANADQQMEDNEQLIHVFSAGNSGGEDCGQYPTGWGNITGGYKQGKNVFAVANLTNTDVASGSSSRGPASDGRIKPDIGAVGSSVLHTQAGNTYGTKSGTSMAAPAVSGALSQLYQAYRTLNSNQDPNAALIRALTLNTAEDLGNEGPDFIYGWGRINARKAYELMANNQYINGTISNSQSLTHNINVPNDVDQVKIMVYWTDPAGVSGATKALVNDIDMTVTNGGSTELPWVLAVSENDANVLNTPATKGADHLNNMEQVIVDNPSGTLTINLDGFNIPEGPQEYYITYEFVKDEIVVTYPFGGERLANDEQYTIRWDAFGDNGSFDIEFSDDNGNSWSTIASGINGSRRYYEGWVPAATTNKGLIRVTRGNVSDVSNVPFTSIGVAQNPTFEWSCDDKAFLTWDAVSNATGYTVYQMGAKYMEPIGTSASNTFIVDIPTNSSDYFAIAANYNDSVGRRTIAFLKNAGTFGTCPNGPDLATQTIIAPVENGCLEGGSSQDVTVLFSNQGTQNITSFTASYTFDGNTVNQVVNTTLAPGATYELTFNTPITLPNNGQYTLTVSGTANNDNISNNDQLQITVNLDQVSYGLPVSEDFDNQSNCSTARDCGAVTCNINSWLANVANNIDDHDWRVHNGGTASSGTGPSGDNSGNGKYIYLEASDCFNSTAELKSSCIEMTGSPTLTFYYHMFGNNIGNLSVQVYDPTTNTTNIEWSLSGDQGDQWQQATVDLSAYSNKTVIVSFVGNSTSSWGGDIAIDDILIETVDLADIEISASTNSMSICDSITVSADGPDANNTYDWDFGTDAVPATASGQGPHTVYFTSVGTKNITCTGDNNLSDAISVNVTGAITEPTASINLDNNPTCSSEDFNFSASGTDLGNTPTYSWKLNGNEVSTSDSYTLSGGTNGDVVELVIQSSAVCLAEDTAMASYTINKQDGEAHSVYISSSSYNQNHSWTLINSNNVTIHSNGNYSTSGNYEVQTFCLTDDCYDFEITNAFSAGGCAAPAWQAQAYPTAGTQVSHNGGLFQSKWWAGAGDEPNANLSGGATPWEYLGPCQNQIDTDVFGLKKISNDSSYFEVAVINYSSPYGTNFCLTENLVADFSANNTNANTCDSVTFSANVSGTPSTYSWDFGNGASPANANGEGPHKVLYNSAGSATVSLTLDGNETETKVNYISITDNKVTPSISIAMETDPWCEGDTIEFSVNANNEGNSPTVQWLVNGSTITSLNNTGNYITHLIQSDDNVQAVLNSSEACVTKSTDSSNVITVQQLNCVITGFTEIDDDATMVFPNPVHDNMFIQTNGDYTRYEVYNITGSKVLQGVIVGKTTSVNIENLERGHYFVQVVGTKDIATFKIVVR
jgi:hypothetical protein